MTLSLASGTPWPGIRAAPQQGRRLMHRSRPFHVSYSSRLHLHCHPLAFSRGAVPRTVLLSSCAMHRNTSGSLRLDSVRHVGLSNAQMTPLRTPRGNAPLHVSASSSPLSPCLSSFSKFSCGPQQRVSSSQKRFTGRGKRHAQHTDPVTTPLSYVRSREPVECLASFPARSTLSPSLLFGWKFQKPREWQSRCASTMSSSHPPLSVKMRPVSPSCICPSLSSFSQHDLSSFSSSSFPFLISDSSPVAFHSSRQLSPAVRTRFFLCSLHDGLPGRQQARQLTYTHVTTCVSRPSPRSPLLSFVPSRLSLLPLCCPSPSPPYSPASSFSTTEDIAPTSVLRWQTQKEENMGWLPCQSHCDSRFEGGQTFDFPGEENRLFAGLYSQQKRWWTRASGMRNPVKWTRDWEVLNRKVYFAFDEREMRRSMLDAVSAHRKAASLFHKMINVVPGVAHALSLPGPHTFFLPTDKACSAHLSPETLHALKDRIAFLEEQQQQRLGNSAVQRSATAISSLRGGTAAAIAARVAKTTEQLRAFVLGHVVPGEWRMKTLLLACGAGGPGGNNLQLEDTERELFAPIMYASRLASAGKRRKDSRASDRNRLPFEGDESEREEADGQSVFSLPPPLSTEDPLPVWVETSRYAAFLPITTSTNFPRTGKGKEENVANDGPENTENGVLCHPKNDRVGGALHLWVAGAQVIKGDLRAHNGVVHMIDKPLIPAQLLATDN